ncbi:DUF664 domain-containing protein [Rhodococcus aerolatus]
MDVEDVMTELFERVRALVPTVLEGLDDEALATRPDGRGNSVAWLVWHTARVQDDHVSGVAGTEQVWTADGWSSRFGLDLPVEDFGYGHGDAEVATVRAPGELLAGYHAAVADRTAEYLRGLTAADLDRVVDEHWDPPVTLGVRLVSVVGDTTQHLGQAAYVRGLLLG